MKVQRISIEEAKTLEGTENSFLVTEKLVVSMNHSVFTLAKTAVTPYVKSYETSSDIDKSSEDSETYGILVDQSLAAKISLSISWNNFGTIDHLVVAKAHRQKGLAATLIEHAKFWSLQKNLHGLQLETQTNNCPACSLYSKTGFALGGIDTHVYKALPKVASETAIYWYWIPANDA